MNGVCVYVWFDLLIFIACVFIICVLCKICLYVLFM